VAFHELHQLLISIYLEGPHLSSARQDAPMGRQDFLEPPPVVRLHVGKVHMRTDELVPRVFQLLRGRFDNIARPRLCSKCRTHARDCFLVERLYFFWLGTIRLVECLLHALYLVLFVQRPLIQESLQLFGQQPPDM
jgi:hypothetical protein